MKYKRLIALFPCENLEDFDLDRSDADAEQLLSAWSILWHPALLADQDDIPDWLPPSTPPDDPSDCLIVVPDCCESSLPDEWIDEAEQAGACMLRGMSDRRMMLEIALQHSCATDGLSGSAASSVDNDLAADFLALGYCHLQVELLNRKSRYMSNLDESGLRIAALDAARAAVAGDAAEAREQLHAAFDRLHEAREYFHPLEIRLLDLTLMAPTTIGNLRDRLTTCPTNMLVAGEVLERMAADEPKSLEALRKALEDGSVELIGGEFAEAPLPLLGPEAIGLLLARGIAAYEKYLQHQPTVFGRRRFGLTPVLPMILRRSGFSAAFHCTLDDGRFPVGTQARVQWEGFDSTSIDSLCRIPLDAGRASSFLKLADKLADAMNIDQTPTLVFAHWPGGECQWYEDIRRCSAYCTVLGGFSSISAYFDQTSFAGHQGRHNPDAYSSPYLTQDAAAGRPDPISRWVRYFARRAKIDAVCALRTMNQCLVGGLVGEEKKEEREEKREEGGERREWDEAALGIEDARDGTAADDAKLDERIGRLLDEPLEDFARLIGGGSDSTERGTLAVNPCCFQQRSQGEEVPSLGFAWTSTQTDAAANVEQPRRRGLFRRKQTPPLAEPNVLRNEFFEIKFDPATGAIRSVSDYHHRDPRLAQQIAMRISGKRRADDEANYSIMAAERIEVVSAGPTLGEIVAVGKLVDREGKRLAGFKQTTRVRRGSRIIEMAVDLDVDCLPDEDPWDSYYAVRFAWKDETLNFYRSVNMANVPTELARIESPHFVDLRRERMRTTLLCGGLPYHRRYGTRKLDTLLIVHGETARSFRLGMGIDLPHPMPAALGMISPPLELPDRPQPSSPTGWLFYLDCRNVVATHWEPLPDNGTNETPDVESETSENSRRLTASGGFRVRLLETDGRRIRLGLRCPHTVSSARILTTDKSEPKQLDISDDRVEIPIGPHQWLEVEVRLS